MPGQRERRGALKLMVFVAIVGSGSPCFSEEPAYADEFFATGDHPSVDAPAPLFAMNEGGEEVENNLMALASAAASPSLERQFQPAIGAPRNYPRRSPFEPKSNGFFRTMGVGMFVSAAADLATTELGLATPGIVEMNPLQGNRGVRIATHVAVPAFLYWATERARKKGDVKLALLLRIGVNVAYSYAAMHNARSLAGYP